MTEECASAVHLHTVASLIKACHRCWKIEIDTVHISPLRLEASFQYMPRLSCLFCIMPTDTTASESAFVRHSNFLSHRNIWHNPGSCRPDWLMWGIRPAFIHSNSVYIVFWQSEIQTSHIGILRNGLRMAFKDKTLDATCLGVASSQAVHS